jgi:adenine deaminase
MIVDVRNGEPRQNFSIVLENDQIVEISNSPIYASSDDQVLDATGQYILPGLIGAHVHYEDFSPELFLNHDVTTVLDLVNDYEWIKATSEAIEILFPFHAGKHGRFPGSYSQHQADIVSGLCRQSRIILLQ